MPDVILELLQAFRADALPLLAEMREAAQTGTRNALKHAAHGIKGAAANLGGSDWRQGACAWNRWAEREPRRGAADLVPNVQEEFDRFCAALEASAEAV